LEIASSMIFLATYQFSKLDLKELEVLPVLEVRLELMAVHLMLREKILPKMTWSEMELLPTSFSSVRSLDKPRDTLVMEVEVASNAEEEVEAGGVRNEARQGVYDRTPYRVVLTCPSKNLLRLLRRSWEMLTLRKTQKGRRTSKAAKKHSSSSYHAWQQISKWLRHHTKFQENLMMFKMY
jgi:hypothetical protein